MTTQRRSVLKKIVASIAGVAGLDVVAKAANTEDVSTHTVMNFDQQTQQLWAGVTIHNGLVYVAGLGYHDAPFTIEEHTTQVLKQMKQRLEAAGSSMEKVLKVNVYLNDINDYAAMNKAYNGHFGVTTGKKPVRTTVAVAKGGVPADSLVEIDCIAYI